ncbi:MAG: two-component regulator propeller domain-containing protein [Pirellulales bacterium]
MQVLKVLSRLLAAACWLICWETTSYASPLPLIQTATLTTQTTVGDIVEKLGDHLMLVHQDNQNQWWFATWGDGLYRYDGKTIVHFTTKHGLSHNRIDQILEDSSGNLFFSTPSGVSRFDGKQVVTLAEVASSEWKLTPGDLWLKNSKFDGHVFRFDGKILHSLKLPKIKIGEDSMAKHPGSPSPYAVYSVYRDKQANVWFGTGALGVLRYDGKKFDWLTSDDVNELHDGPSNGVRSIIEDHEGNFWFNTRYRYAINPSSPLQSTAASPDGIFQRLPGIGSLDGKPDGEYEYLSIAKDRNDLLWIATYRHGVFCYDGKQLKHFPIMDGSKVVTLFTVYVDRAGAVWLGTHANGAYRFNGTSFERFFPSKRVD